MTTFEFIRERLIEAGRKGISQAELHRALRASVVARRDGTYDSFRYYFWVLKKLKWVIQTGRTEKASRLPDVLSEKIFYRITPTGRKAPVEDWKSPQAIAYPQYAIPGRTRRWYKPTGRPRGRPRVVRRRVVPKRIERVERVEVEAPPRRVVRLTVSMRARIELEKLAERVEVLRDDPSGLDDVERDVTRTFDMVVDAIESARGEERAKLDDLANRLDKASEGLVEMREGLERDRRTTYLRGWEKLRQYIST